MSADEEWVDFAHSLAEALRDLETDDTLSLHLPPDGCEDGDLFGAPYCQRYVQFCAYGPGWLRCEVVGNQFLGDRHQHTRQQERRLVRIGWTRPRDADGHGSPNFWVDVECAWADFAADMVVRALREVWDVESPWTLLVDDPHAVLVHLATPAGLR